jgi:dephospho-CoA kinase
MVAVTGTIGSGKSSFCRLLENLGAKVIYADKVCHQIFDDDKNVAAQLAAKFGADIIMAAGGTDRAKLREHTFKDAESRAAVEKILRPAIMDRMGKECRDAIANGHGVVFGELPVLFENNLQVRKFRQIVVVNAESQVCLDRAVLRGGDTPEGIQKKLDTQLPGSEKIKLGDVVIDNSGTLVDLEQTTREYWTYLQTQIASDCQTPASPMMLECESFSRAQQF